MDLHISVKHIAVVVVSVIVTAWVVMSFEITVSSRGGQTTDTEMHFTEEQIALQQKNIRLLEKRIRLLEKESDSTRVGDHHLDLLDSESSRSPPLNLKSPAAHKNEDNKETGGFSCNGNEACQRAKDALKAKAEAENELLIAKQEEEKMRKSAEEKAKKKKEKPEVEKLPEESLSERHSNAVSHDISGLERVIAAVTKQRKKILDYYQG